MTARTNQPRPWLESDDPRGREFLEEAFEAVKAEMATGTISVDRIAIVMNLGMQSFRRRLIKYSGLTPKAFFNAIQMDHAMHLLTHEPEMQVTDIAKHCGFENISSFGHAFKRSMGCSALEYRQAHTRKSR